ncbi:hypothetical protein Dimus_017510 [Dionaea muscipula]
MDAVKAFPRARLGMMNDPTKTPHGLRSLNTTVWAGHNMHLSEELKDEMIDIIGACDQGKGQGYQGGAWLLARRGVVSLAWEGR